jgi:hypothetical protein
MTREIVLDTENKAIKTLAMLVACHLTYFPQTNRFG